MHYYQDIFSLAIISSALKNTLLQARAKELFDTNVLK